MKKIIQNALIGLTALFVIPAFADQTETDLLGGNFSFWGYMGNERMFRGNSETQNGEVPAIQTMITWSHEDSGIYLGYWGATVKFDLAPDVYAQSGPYIGKSGTIGDTGINYNVLLWHYIYHVDEGPNYDYTELYFQANKQFGKLNIAGEIVPTLDDWFGVDGVKGLSYQLTPTYDLGNGYTTSFTFGRQSFDSNQVQQWNYWDIGVAKTFAKGWKVDVRYHDTNYPSSRDTTNIWKEHFVVAVSKSF